jgi:hypothetical protein
LLGQEVWRQAIALSMMASRMQAKPHPPPNKRQTQRTGQGARPDPKGLGKNSVHIECCIGPPEIQRNGKPITTGIKNPAKWPDFLAVTTG